MDYAQITVADHGAVTVITLNRPDNDTAGGVGGMPKGLDWVSFLRQSKPIVCAVNGAAVGIGTTMCLPADQIIAITNAKFGMFFITMGLVPVAAFLAKRPPVFRPADLSDGA